MYLPNYRVPTEVLYLAIIEHLLRSVPRYQAFSFLERAPSYFFINLEMTGRTVPNPTT